MVSRSKARKWLVFVGCLIVSIVGYELYRTRYLPPTDGVLRIYGGRKYFNTILHPDQISVYRIDPEPEGISMEILDFELFETKRPADFDVISGPVAVTERQHQIISRILARDSTYPSGWFAKACGLPSYGVRLDFKRGDDLVQLLLCFRCAEMGIFLNGESKGRVYFDGGKNDLIRLVKQLFPNDTELQAL